MYKMHHPKSDLYRLYLPRPEGGRGLIQLELSYESTTISLDKYFHETQDTLLHFVKDHDERKSLYSISRQSMKFSRELGVPAIPPAEDKANTTYVPRIKAKAKHQGRQQLRSKWESKALHGTYPQRVKQADVDQDKTQRWLKAAGLKAETKGFIIAAQDQSLSAHWYPKCRLCGRFDETIDHLVSGCPELAKTEYIIGVGRMSWFKSKTVAVVMGALGTIKMDMENFSNKIPGNINIHEPQEKTLLSKAHLFRWVLSIK